MGALLADSAFLVATTTHTWNTPTERCRSGYSRGRLLPALPLLLRRSRRLFAVRGELSGETRRGGHSGTDEDDPPPAVPREVQLFKTPSQSDIQHPVLTKSKSCSASKSHCSLRSQPPRAPCDVSVFSDLDRHRGHNSQAPRGRRAQAWLQTTAGLCQKYDSGASCAGCVRSQCAR